MADEKPAEATQAAGADAPSDTDAAGEGSAGSGRSRWILLGGAAAVLVVALAGAGFLLLDRGTPEGEPEPEAAGAAEEPEAEVAPAKPASEPAAELGEVLPLEAFVVNISDQERDRYLKVKAELEVGSLELGEEVRKRMPQVRDLILSLLGSKSFAEVRTIEGKNFLREEILLRVNTLLQNGQVRRVFFTEFVVQ